MKPSRLNRRTGSLKRTALKPGKGIGRGRRKGDKQTLRDNWLSTQTRCAACWGNRKLDPHHILGGYNRVDAVWNLLALCRFCHDKLDKGFVAVCLKLKAESDKSSYSRTAMLKFLDRPGANKYLPPMARKLPDWIIEARGKSVPPPIMPCYVCNGLCRVTRLGVSEVCAGCRGTGRLITERVEPKGDSKERRESA